MRPKILICALIPAATFHVAPVDGQPVWRGLGTDGSPHFSHHDATWDATASRMVVCGRRQGSPPGSIETWFLQADQTWVAGPTAQSRFPNTFGSDVEIAHDPVRHATVLYTSDGTGTETWELVGDEWQLRAPAHEPVRSPDGAHLLFFPPANRTVLVGTPGFPGEDSPSETWFWDGTDWARVASGEPTGAAGGGMAYDANRQELVLVTMMQMRTWSFQGGAWSRKSPDHLPSPGVWVFDLAFDPVSGRSLFFGGEGFDPGAGQSLYPVKTWAWDGTDWSPLETPESPPNTIDYALEYCPPLGGLLLHGGWGEADNWEPRNILWLLSSGSPVLPPVGPVRIELRGDRVRLGWEAVPGAAGYRVLSSPDVEGPYGPDAGGTLDGLSWEKPLGPGHEYFWIEPTAGDPGVLR